MKGFERIGHTVNGGNGQFISQSAYSKFETGIRDVDASVYLQLLQRLNIPAEEFEYVRNDYDYGRKQNLIHELFSIDYNHMENLHTLKTK